MKLLRSIAAGIGLLTVFAYMLGPLFAGDVLDAPLVNSFPARWTADVYRGQPNRKTGVFRIYFPTTADKYVPISPQMAELLSLPPEVSSPKQIGARVLNTTCEPEEVVVASAESVATAKGGAVRTEIEVTPGPSAGDGEYEIVLTYPIIGLAMNRLGVSAPLAEARLTVTVWESETVRIATLARIEEERKRKEAAEAEAARIAKAAEDRKRREELFRLLGKIGPIGLGLAAVGILLVKLRARSVNVQGERKLREGILDEAFSRFRSAGNMAGMAKVGEAGLVDLPRWHSVVCEAFTRSGRWNELPILAAGCISAAAKDPQAESSAKLLQTALEACKTARDDAGIGEVYRAAMGRVEVWHGVALDACRASAREEDFRELGRRCASLSDAQSGDEDALRLMATSFQALQSAKDQEGLAILGHAALRRLERSRQPGGSPPLRKLSLDALQAAADNAGILRLAECYCRAAADARNPAEALESLRAVLKPLTESRGTAGLVRLGDAAMAAARRETKKEHKLEITSLALQAYQAAENPPGLAACRAARRAIGRQNLGSTRWDKLKTPERHFQPGLGDPTLLIGADWASAVDVCVDYYDSYRVAGGGSLTLQLEPGVHHLRFAPDASGATNSIEGRIELESNYAYLWSFTVTVETVYR